MNKKLVSKLTTNLALPPRAEGENVFSTKEFAVESNVSSRTAREHIAKLAAQGLVRRVRRGNEPAWEWVGK